MSSARSISLATAAALLAAGIGLSLGATPEERWLLAARFTARVSFPIFLLAFTASSWARLAPGAPTRALLRGRRGIGLGFAAAHTVHLGALATYSFVAARPPSAVTLLAGGGAYLAMFAMAATSNDAAVRRLGGAWRTLHTVGVYWLWFVFAFSYGSRVASGRPFFLPQVALAFGALALRIAARRARLPALSRKRVLPIREDRAQRGHEGERLV
jgi:sulfoxide reductase heme-binding subunit YedZ